ncbi:MAG: 16S rRNA (cytosine(1402)-N(4))-methyltransferase RsmH, partial [Buchnera aphidicola]|nr:16S rRNA (cytosine(1402)-N(4))-methyltransferase RsmH [Buchnera aphidicola]
LKKFGEEKFARRIACAIKKYQIKKNINSTLELVDIIKKAIPIKNKFKHPARKTFQALRIYINQELKELKTGLRETLKILKPGGRLTIISFHSLEDRIVKKFMVKNSTKAIVPYSMPITEKQLYNLKKVKLTVIDRIYPSQKEIQKNPKSRSSILRVAQFNKN